MIKSFVSNILKKNDIPIINTEDTFIFYTAAFGSGYSFEEFQNLDYNYKIFIFTDQKNFLNLNNKNFKVFLVKGKLKNIFMNRIFKFLPHKIFPKVQMTGYFDAKKFPNKNIKISKFKSNIDCDIMISKLNLEYQCIYKHYNDLIKKKIIPENGNFQNLINHYKKSKFPKEYGLGDTCIILKKRNINIENMFEKLLFFIVKLNFFRDQMLFMYFLWRNKKINLLVCDFKDDFSISKNTRVKIILFKKMYNINRENFFFKFMNKLTFNFLDKLLVK